MNGFEGFRVGKVSIYTRVFFFFFNIIYTGRVRAGYAYTQTRPEPASGFLIKTQTRP